MRRPIVRLLAGRVGHRRAPTRSGTTVTAANTAPSPCEPDMAAPGMAASTTIVPITHTAERPRRSPKLVSALATTAAAQRDEERATQKQCSGQTKQPCQIGTGAGQFTRPEIGCRSRVG